MATDLRDFLTGDEKRQMDALLLKAEERMREKGEEGCNGQIFLMACQCNCKQMVQEEEEKEGFEEDVKIIFSDICGFCRTHGLCSKYCEEELPFP